jgi:hypothetical protein
MKLCIFIYNHILLYLIMCGQISCITMYKKFLLSSQNIMDIGVILERFILPESSHRFSCSFIQLSKVVRASLEQLTVTLH